MHRYCLLLLATTWSVHTIYGLNSEQQVLQSPVNVIGPYDVRYELIKAEIIPAVVGDFLPTLALTAQWSSTVNATLGNVLRPEKLQDAPSIILDTLDSSYLWKTNMTHVIALTDPDAPSRDNPKWAEMCHWIASGPVISTTGGEKDAYFPGSLLLSLDDIMPYKPPGPPERTGKHRYIFLTLVPANGTTEKLRLSVPADRQHWGTGMVRHGVKDWARDNGLVPVAANFIYAQNKRQ